MDSSRYGFRETLLNLTATRARVALSDPSRVYIGFLATTGAYAISTRPGLVITQGMVVQLNGPIVEFYWHKHGSYCQSEWYAIAGANITAIMIEVWELAGGVPLP